MGGGIWAEDTLVSVMSDSDKEFSVRSDRLVSAALRRLRVGLLGVLLSTVAFVLGGYLWAFDDYLAGSLTLALGVLFSIVALLCVARCGALSAHLVLGNTLRRKLDRAKEERRR